MAVRSSVDELTAESVVGGWWELEGWPGREKEVTGGLPLKGISVLTSSPLPASPSPLAFLLPILASFLLFLVTMKGSACCAMDLRHAILVTTAQK